MARGWPRWGLAAAVYRSRPTPDSARVLFRSRKGKAQGGPRTQGRCRHQTCKTWFGPSEPQRVAVNPQPFTAKRRPRMASEATLWRVGLTRWRGLPSTGVQLDEPLRG